MENNLNNELENTIANDMAYAFSKNMLMANQESKQMIETAQRYGLSEKTSSANDFGIRFYPRK